MFVRAKKSGPYQYLQLLWKTAGKAPSWYSELLRRSADGIGSLPKGISKSLVRSLSRFSEQASLVLSGKSELLAEARKIGPALVFGRLWEDFGMGMVLKELLKDRLFSFDVERAVFLTVLHRLMVSGSDKFRR